ncbi:MAG: hypothetical protein LBI06_08935 [Treponema sp.]|jgi:hypothetical protein|nr:hypothetical protein [Treponema sp.]
MKKNLFFACFIAVMLVFPYFSPAQTPPSATDLNAAVTMAEEARQKAIDFESPSYFPSDWEDAEAQYAQARLTSQSGGEAIRMSIDAYSRVSAIFLSLFEKTIPLYAQAKEDEIMAMRGELIAAGIRDAEPEYFSNADRTALLAFDQYEVRDYYAARDTAALAFSMYLTLQNVYNALLARYEIIERSFEDYDPDNFDRAEDLLNKAMEAYGYGDISLAAESSSEAVIFYNMVLDAGWPSYAEQRFLRAEAERQAAMDMKAHIANRDFFAEADSSLRSAISSFEAEDFREAANQFIHSEAMFIIASTSATEKRRRAAEAIREARRKIDESAENAREAETVIRGGAR